MKRENILAKRVAAAVLSVVVAMGVVVTPGFTKTAKAAETNVSRAAAMEVAQGTVASGLIVKNQPDRERWFKFTNNTGSDAYVEVTITGKAGTEWSHYYFYDNKGSGDDESGIVTGLTKTFRLGINKGECEYLKIEAYEADDTCGFTVSASYAAEETNSFSGLKKIKSGKSIYGKLDYKKDVDTYMIKAKKSGKMTVKITNNNIGGYVTSLEYTVYSKSRSAKATGRVDEAKTGKAKIKVKKGQCIYVQVKGRYMGDKSLGDYTIKTKIK